MNDHVKCMVCGRRKKPIGRDSMDNGLCDRDCPGYSQEPHAGHLWPSEIAAAPAATAAVPLCTACTSGDHQWHTGGELLGPGSCVNGECRCEVRPVVPAAAVPPAPNVNDRCCMRCGYLPDMHGSGFGTGSCNQFVRRPGPVAQPAPTAEGGKLASGSLGRAEQMVLDHGSGTKLIHVPALLGALRAAAVEHAAQLDERARSFGSATFARQKAERERDAAIEAGLALENCGDPGAACSHCMRCVKRSLVVALDREVRLGEERDEARAEVERLKADCAQISEELDLPPTMRPAPGELRRMRDALRASQSAPLAANLGELRAKLEAACVEHIQRTTERDRDQKFIDAIFAILPAHDDRKTEAGR